MAFVEEPAADGSETGIPPDGATPNNRTFIIAAVVMGALFIAGLLCIGVYAFVLGPQRANAQATANAEILAANATTLAQQTQLAAVTNTPTTAPSDTPTIAASDTPVIQPTNTATSPPLPTDTPTIVPTTAVPPTETPTTEGGASPTPTKLGEGGTVTGTVASPITGTVSAPGGSATPTPLVGGLTRTPGAPTPTQLPGTGFADEAGVPQLVFLGLVLVAVVIVVRQLRLRLR